jgi:hypothetical protein
MDYECDFGFRRAFGSLGKCELEIKKSDWESQTLQREEEMCIEYGYYFVSKGYRKIPGNLCEGGLKLLPEVFQCNAAGSLSRFLSSLNTILYCGIAGIILYLIPKP